MLKTASKLPSIQVVVYRDHLTHLPLKASYAQKATLSGAMPSPGLRHHRRFGHPLPEGPDGRDWSAGRNASVTGGGTRAPSRVHSACAERPLHPLCLSPSITKALL